MKHLPWLADVEREVLGFLPDVDFYRVERVPPPYPQVPSISFSSQKIQSTPYMRANLEQQVSGAVPTGESVVLNGVLIRGTGWLAPLMTPAFPTLRDVREFVSDFVSEARGVYVDDSEMVVRIYLVGPGFDPVDPNVIPHLREELRQRLPAGVVPDIYTSWPDRGTRRLEGTFPRPLSEEATAHALQQVDPRRRDLVLAEGSRVGQDPQLAARVMANLAASGGRFGIVSVTIGLRRVSATSELPAHLPAADGPAFWADAEAQLSRLVRTLAGAGVLDERPVAPRPQGAPLVVRDGS